ncbi:MAG: hypothetical protein MZV63_19335 [Marinilabiliales bacterium]|nr:hypothetical protein [Marinilabiliales bacterium]
MAAGAACSSAVSSRESLGLAARRQGRRTVDTALRGYPAAPSCSHNCRSFRG